MRYLRNITQSKCLLRQRNCKSIRELSTSTSASTSTSTAPSSSPLTLSPSSRLTFINSSSSSSSSSSSLYPQQSQSQFRFSSLYSSSFSSSSSSSTPSSSFSTSSISKPHTLHSRSFSAAAATDKLTQQVFEKLPKHAQWDEEAYVKLKAEVQAEAMREWERKQIEDPTYYALPPNGSKDVLSRRTKLIIKDVTSLTLFEIMQLEREMRDCVQLNARNSIEYFKLQETMKKTLQEDPRYKDLYAASTSSANQAKKPLDGATIVKHRRQAKRALIINQRRKDAEVIDKIEALRNEYFKLHPREVKAASSAPADAKAAGKGKKK